MFTKTLTCEENQLILLKTNVILRFKTLTKFEIPTQFYILTGMLIYELWAESICFGNCN